jgi:hypothetical protein
MKPFKMCEIDIFVIDSNKSRMSLNSECGYDSSL